MVRLHPVHDLGLGRRRVDLPGRRDAALPVERGAAPRRSRGSRRRRARRRRGGRRARRSARGRAASRPSRRRGWRGSTPRTRGSPRWRARSRRRGGAPRRPPRTPAAGRRDLAVERRHVARPTRSRAAARVRTGVPASRERLSARKRGTRLEPGRHRRRAARRAARSRARRARRGCRPTASIAVPRRSQTRCVSSVEERLPHVVRLEVALEADRRREPGRVEPLDRGEVGALRRRSPRGRRRARRLGSRPSCAWMPEERAELRGAPSRWPTTRSSTRSQNRSSSGPASAVGAGRVRIVSDTGDLPVRVDAVASGESAARLASGGPSGRRGVVAARRTAVSARAARTAAIVASTSAASMP